MTLMEMDPDFGAYSHGTGWMGEIHCTCCGRRVVYVGNSVESKVSVKKKLRRLWHVANEVMA